MTEQLTPEEIAGLDPHDPAALAIAAEAGYAPVVETRSVARLGGVNFADRIITVIAVPYEEPTPIVFRRENYTEVFSRSAFLGIESRETSPNARVVPVTACLELPAENHRGGKLIGSVAKFFPGRKEGLITDLKVSETDTGTEALQLAHDGALSASVGFRVNHRMDERIDTRSKTRRIDRAFLDHVALVADPAYVGARVLAVRSNGSVESDDALGGTPKLDEFLNDPIFEWAKNRTGGC